MEKDAASRIERGDTGKRTDVDKNKTKFVTWKDIDHILASGREARTAFLGHRELTVC